MHTALIIALFLIPCFAWNQDDLRMFDLVDELKVNFYDFLGVDQTASSDAIRKAYRKLSVKYHPDRNPDDPNAGDKFRQLVEVYETLKDPEARERYNDVLVNGLPDWRNAVFYYRKLRKMSNVELFTLFAVLSTSIHYLVLWGSRYEKLWNMEEQLSTFYKRHKAKDKRREVIEQEIAQQLSQVPKPKWHDLLPFAICKAMYYLVSSLPLLLSCFKSQVSVQIDRIQEERNLKKELAEEQLLKERAKAEKQERKRRLAEEKSKQVSPYSSEVLEGYISISDVPLEQPDDPEPTGNSSREWSEDDVTNLVRAVAKFPGGVPGRWARIAEQVDRPMADVISKVRELGEKRINAVYSKSEASYEIPAFEVNENDVCGDDDADATNRENPAPVVSTTDQPMEITETEAAPTVTVDEPYMSRKKQKQQRKELAIEKGREAKGSLNNEDGWTQIEQKQLEVAIRTIDKSTPERWDRIADCVPTKTKAEVMLRVKQLSNLVKTRVHRT